MERIIAIFVVLSVSAAKRVPSSHSTDTASVEVAYPRAITADRFEEMLQRASQILRSPPQVIETTVESNDELPISKDHRQGYYYPLFQADKSQKLDAKSRQMQYMRPPPEANPKPATFFAIKQKKLPKKFVNAAKQINVKVIDDGETGELPPRTHGYRKEHNVIFDDAFYGVDSQAPVPDDVPQEHNVDHGYIEPLYSRRLHKTDDMFATSASKRESRMRLGVPVTRFSVISF